jgi:hypothetical protein
MHATRLSPCCPRALLDAALQRKVVLVFVFVRVVLVAVFFAQHGAVHSVRIQYCFRLFDRRGEGYLDSEF